MALQPQSPQQMNVLDDTSSIAMFTAVGHVGLHLVIRPLVRWGIRSFILKSKQYIDDGATKNNDKSAILESESQIEAQLLEENKNKNKNASKKSKNLSNINSGLAGSYSEIVATFGSLAGISY